MQADPACAVAGNLIQRLLQCAIDCMPAGADVGGFFGNADSELLVRWNQLGTYYPFFRGHGHLETKRREPWLFGEDNTRRNRDSLRERYALLPYLYTLFWESHTQGTLIMRPLWYEFPEVRCLLVLLYSYSSGMVQSGLT